MESRLQNEVNAVGAELLAKVGDDVLVSLLEQDAVPMDTLHERYGSLLELVRVLIGVVPVCDRYLEIWPPAFRTYNLIVPNFLNLPFAIFGIGKAPRELVGLGMYVASRAAECPYCTAHTCSYALRRGASPETVANAFIGEGDFSDRELAAIAVAKSLARIPCELSAQQHSAMQKHYSAVEAEWVVLGVAMMGFLNKFMDVIGVQLETSTVAETRQTMGENWSPGKAGRALAHHNTTEKPGADSLKTRLSVVKHAPAALKLDKQWQQGVPDQWPQVGEYLAKHTGYNFPVLSQMHNARAIRAIATVLRENLDQSQSSIGVDMKVKAGVVFCAAIQDESLGAVVASLSGAVSVTQEHIEALKHYANNAEADLPANTAQNTALLTLAKAASPSPALITADVVNECRAADIASESIVEMVTWLAVLQMLHRLSSYVQFSEMRSGS